MLITPAMAHWILQKTTEPYFEPSLPQVLYFCDVIQNGSWGPLPKLVISQNPDAPEGVWCLPEGGANRLFAITLVGHTVEWEVDVPMQGDDEVRDHDFTFRVEVVPEDSEFSAISMLD